jgi:hypothetical protein
MSDATGRDLSRLFVVAKTAVEIDHGIASLESKASCGAGCVQTELWLHQQGPVPFPMLVRVTFATFADGQHVDALWNGGRDRFTFESAAPAIEAHLDPHRVWQLDQNPLNNAVRPRAPTNVPVWKWMSRWVIWLQEAMLTMTFPV